MSGSTRAPAKGALRVWMAGVLCLAAFGGLQARAQGAADAVPSQEEQAVHEAAAEESAAIGAEITGKAPERLERRRLARLALRSRRPGTRILAVQAIARAAQDAQVSDADGAARNRLRRWQRRAVGVLARAMRDREPKVQVAAISALRDLVLGPEEHRGIRRSVLRLLLSFVPREKSPELRVAALDLAIELASSRREIRTVAQLAARDADPQIRELAQELFSHDP